MPSKRVMCQHSSSVGSYACWLQADGCISVGENDEIESLTMGRICSFYYLKHQTMGLFAASLHPDMDFKQVRLTAGSTVKTACANRWGCTKSSLAWVVLALFIEKDTMCKLKCEPEQVWWRR